MRDLTQLYRDSWNGQSQGPAGTNLAHVAINLHSPEEIVPKLALVYLADSAEQT